MNLKVGDIIQYIEEDNEYNNERPVINPSWLKVLSRVVEVGDPISRTRLKIIGGVMPEDFIRIGTVHYLDHLPFKVISKKSNHLPGWF